MNVESSKPKESYAVVVSPNEDKEECEFTKHLTANLNSNENIHDTSFIDAISTIQPSTTQKIEKNNLEKKILEQNSMFKENRVNDQENVDGLVDEWKETKTPQGKIYFYNRRTRQSAWK